MRTGHGSVDENELGVDRSPLRSPDQDMDGDDAA
jgi:hypothetical protein